MSSRRERRRISGRERPQYAILRRSMQAWFCDATGSFVHDVAKMRRCAYPAFTQRDAAQEMTVESKDQVD